MSNPFGKVVGFIKHAAVVIAHGFIALFGHDNAAAFGHASLGILDTAIGKIAVKVVEGLNSLAPSPENDVKRAQAFSAIVAEAKNQGIGVSNSIVNLLIELAVQFVKGSFAKADSTDPVVVKFAEGADAEIGESATDNTFGDESKAGE